MRVAGVDGSQVASRLSKITRGAKPDFDGQALPNIVCSSLETRVFREAFAASGGREELWLASSNRGRSVPSAKGGECVRSVDGGGARGQRMREALIGRFKTVGLLRGRLWGISEWKISANGFPNEPGRSSGKAGEARKRGSRGQK